MTQDTTAYNDGTGGSLGIPSSLLTAIADGLSSFVGRELGIAATTEVTGLGNTGDLTRLNKEEERIELLLEVYDGCITQEGWRRLKVLNKLRPKDARPRSDQEKK